MENKKNGTNAIKEYEVLRVLALLLVIFSHSTYYNISSPYGGCDYSALAADPSMVLRLLRFAKTVVYVFHMPLFMALSGALFYYSVRRASGFADFVKAKALRLLLPFVFACLCYSVPIKYLTGYYAQSKNVLYDIVMGQLLLQGNTHLWYCAALFVIFAAAYLAEKHLGRTFKTILIVLLYLASPFIPVNIAAYAAEYLLWFYCGYCFEAVRADVNKKVNVKNIVVCMVLAAAFWLPYYIFSGKDTAAAKLLLAAARVPAVLLFSLFIYGTAYMASHIDYGKSRLFMLLHRDSFGAYLYSDPLNYVFLAICTSMFGNKVFCTEAGALLFFCLRFFGTLIFAVLFTELLRKLKLKYVY